MLSGFLTFIDGIADVVSSFFVAILFWLFGV